MAYDDDTLNDIYDKTGGLCHLCGKRLAFTNYGCFGARAAWEVDHSRPRAKGGTDYFRNLMPACIPCNRSKQAGSNRTIRARNGLARAPGSRSARGRWRGEDVALAVLALGILVALDG